MLARYVVPRKRSPLLFNLFRLIFLLLINSNCLLSHVFLNIGLTLLCFLFTVWCNWDGDKSSFFYYIWLRQLSSVFYFHSLDEYLGEYPLNRPWCDHLCPLQWHRDLTLYWSHHFIYATAICLFYNWISDNQVFFHVFFILLLWAIF